MYKIGVDLGGTHIGVGLVKDNKILSTYYTDTPKDRDFVKTVKAMADAINTLLEKNSVKLSQCDGIGIGSPGVAEEKTGNIVYSANFGWHDAPLRSELQRYIDLPVAMANDADAAGWAEYLLGAGRGSQSCITITLGTGIGGGMVINGKLFSGGMSGGGELGHVTLVADGRECGCGKKGCAEAYASATAMVKMASEQLAQHPESILNKVEQLNAKAVVDASRQGDELASKVFADYVNYLAHLIASIINLIAPQVIALGGGVAGAGEYLLEPLNKRVDRLILNKKLPRARIVCATMGSDAGILGAALLEL
ncbi:MAG: ROK family protein [Clostridia bacterium]|nr:ROK family protein [Clostridia bacterium]